MQLLKDKLAAAEANEIELHQQYAEVAADIVHQHELEGSGVCV